MLRRAKSVGKLIVNIGDNVLIRHTGKGVFGEKERTGMVTAKRWDKLSGTMLIEMEIKGRRCEFAGDDNRILGGIREWRLERVCDG
jgi:hypothetical protein